MFILLLLLLLTSESLGVYRRERLVFLAVIPPNRQRCECQEQGARNGRSYYYGNRAGMALHMVLEYMKRNSWFNIYHLALKYALSQNIIEIVFLLKTFETQQRISQFKIQSCQNVCATLV